MDSRLIEKLRKVLAMTTSPVEAEAQTAAEMLQRLLTDHNLEMADLEARGVAQKQSVGRKQHDLGKAAFTWKLNLARVMADHYFCFPMVDSTTKTVHFVGRSDNVDALLMLYGWVIEQIKAISAEERRKHIAASGEHVDPLRWQVNFGLGVVSRLRDRLNEIARARAAGTQALVIHHQSEINDWFEEQYGWRPDGQPTKRQRERDEADAALKATDLEAYYRKYPWERPLTPEQQRERDAAAKREEAKQQRNRARRQGRVYYTRPVSAEESRRREQAWTARDSGRASADRVNLEPFIEGRKGGTRKEELP